MVLPLTYQMGADNVLPALNLTDITLITLLSAIILITLLGNTLIIAAVATTRRLRTVTNYFVVSLAASDLLVGLLVMPLAVVEEVTDQWLFGSIVCEMWISMDVMLCTASILNLCCISLDRYFAITSPLTYAVKRSVRLSLLMIGVVWVVSALITCPPMFGWNESERSNTTQCSYNNNPGYVIYSALGSFYIPAIIMVYVYWRIFAVARKRQAVLMQGSKEGHVSDSNSSTVGEASIGENPRLIVTSDNSDARSQSTSYTLSEMVVHHREQNESSSRRTSFSLIRSSPFFLTRNNSYSPTVTTKLFHHDHHQQQSEKMWTDDDGAQGQELCSSDQSSSSYHCHYCSPRHKPAHMTTIRKKDGYERAAFQRERRVAKSLSVVVGGFIVCWLPFFIVYILEPFCTSCSFHPVLKASLVWLGWINSAINPFIYALNNKDFKKAFVRLTIDKCRCGKKMRKGHNPQQFM